MSASPPDLKAIIAKHREGDYLAAEKGYRELLHQSPEDATALHFLGLLRTQQGRTHEGIELMDMAVRVDPAYVDAWSNLGIAFYDQKDFDRSEKCCRKALELSPGFANAWANLGRALRAKGNYEDAVTAWGRALELQPDMRNVAIPFGQLLYKMNRVDQAQVFYRDWSQRNPDDPLVQHMLAALGGAPAPGRASDDYVRATFDDFAESFDERLRELGYKAPELIHRAALASPVEGASGLSILDLGCGTGLCGELFKPVARRLVGVDLSSRMLSKAAARDCYQQLNFCELTSYLASCTERFDLVLAADVLCYFGDLEAVFKAARVVLASADSRFIFSLEAAPAGAAAEQSFVLKPHGRYEHGIGYVRAILESAGLGIARVTQETLRYERREPVIGHVIVSTTRR